MGYTLIAIDQLPGRPRCDNNLFDEERFSKDAPRADAPMARLKD